MQIVFDSETGELKVKLHANIDTERDYKIANLIDNLPSKSQLLSDVPHCPNLEDTKYSILQCNTCHGVGAFHDHVCPICNGEGFYPLGSAQHNRDRELRAAQLRINERLREKIGRGMGKSDSEIKSDVYRPRTRQDDILGNGRQK
jgi:hypothetical protein